MQPNQVSIRSVPSSELFVKPPQIALASSKRGPETQREQWCPAPALSSALRGRSPAEITCWIQALGKCIAAQTSVRQFKVLLLSALNIPKSSRVDWGLSLTPEQLTDRRGTSHLPDGSATPIEAAVTAYRHLHEQTNCSNSSPWACFQLLILWQAWVKFSLLIIFSEVLRNLRLRTLATKLQKRS